MTERSVPKKPRKSAQAALAAQQREEDPGARSVTWINLFWKPILIAALFYVYLNPTALTGFINDWIGFSEHYDGAPVAHKPVLTSITADVSKRDAIVAAFKHSWHAYERDAMGDDEYHPLTKRGSNLTEAGGIGYMVVDVIDTLQLMDLQDEYSRARQWISDNLSFERDGAFSVFETTIRVLGGLLSAYHLSGGDSLYLEKATELADRMLPAFDTPSGLPLPVINLALREGLYTTNFRGLSSIAEVATLQLEFRYLSHLTDDDEYWRAVEKVMEVVKKAQLPHGLASVFLDIEKGHYHVSTISLGSRGDSFYEYLLKQYLQTNKSETAYHQMYTESIDAIHKYLIQQSMGSKMIYTSELIPETGEEGEVSWRLTPKQDHLVCFLGGSLMLGATHTGTLPETIRVSVPPLPNELSEIGKRDWKTGVELVRTCMNTHDTATGLSPEIVYFRVPSDGIDGHAMPQDWYIKGTTSNVPPPYDARYMLRPETVESLFIAYRLTGDQLYRDHGWKIFQAIEKHCRVESGGYVTIVNSETLKYLFLLFEGASVIPLDEYVFNTEAHPFPIFNPTFHTGFS